MKRIAAGLLATLAVPFLGSAIANATEITGSFDGIAYGSRVNAESPNPGSFDGATVTVTYDINVDALANPDFAYVTPTYSYFQYDASVLSLTFDTPYGSAVYDGTTDNQLIIEIFGSEVDFETSDGPYYFADIDFTGFGTNDLTTYDPSPADIAAVAPTAADFFAGRSFGAGVEVPPAPVPEPATLMLVASGALAWLVISKQRRNRGDRT